MKNRNHFSLHAATLFRHWNDEPVGVYTASTKPQTTADNRPRQPTAHCVHLFANPITQPGKADPVCAFVAVYFEKSKVKQFSTNNSHRIRWPICFRVRFIELCRGTGSKVHHHRHHHLDSGCGESVLCHILNKSANLKHCSVVYKNYRPEALYCSAVNRVELVARKSVQKGALVLISQPAKASKKTGGHSICPSHQHHRSEAVNMAQMVTMESIDLSDATISIPPEIQVDQIHIETPEER